MINGLDLFTGYGGITIALQDWILPIAYCEIDRYAQGILLSRMASGQLPLAPIWDDINTIPTEQFVGLVDVIYGGFPCQDISVAGTGIGLGGKRSGLFFRLLDVVKKIKPQFVFLENVPAIRTRGLREIIVSLTDCGYDCRWTRVSAAEVGAPHLRQRWFLLAHTETKGRQHRKQRMSRGRTKGIPNEGSSVTGIHGETQRLALPNTASEHVESINGSIQETSRSPREQIGRDGFESMDSGLADTNGKGLEVMQPRQDSNEFTPVVREGQWCVEPDVGRVVNGCPFRVDRIKSLGNGVVPLQAKVAFQRLMGAVD